MNNKRYRTQRASWLRIGFMFVTSLSAQLSIAQQDVHLDGVLGTSLDLTFYGVSEKQANMAVNNMSKELTRLENILSTWQEQSSISVLNRTGKLEQAPEELRAVLSLCQRWHNKSQGVFSCRMGGLQQLWRQAQTQQVVPDRVEMRRIARKIQQLPTAVEHQDTQLNLVKPVLLDPAGIAKGYIIDLLMFQLRTVLPKATGIKLDIGGDMLFWGQPSNNKKWLVGLTDNDINLSVTPLSIEVPSVAVASSGHGFRYVEIERRKFSHILQSSDGWPMDNAPRAVVIAPNAATADAIATALSTQQASKGIDWVNGLPGVEASIQSNGIHLTSSGWHKYMLNQQQETQYGEHSINIEYQIPRIKSSKYHRPYLALWITDTRNRSIKQLMLLGESERWAKENTRWWRRVGRKSPGLLDAVARPTRLPGEYHLVWDHIDDQGKKVSPGEYLLHFEAAREGGGHDYHKVSIDTREPIKDILLPAKGELGKTVIRQSDDSLLSQQPQHEINVVEVRP